jgi:NADPH:quinone reductase-like Zn-dependent oxidoreductase
VLRKRLHIIGTVMRARPLNEKIEVVERFMSRSYAWLEAGVVKPVIECVLPAESAAEAHRLIESNVTFGKVVLAWK